MYKVETDASFYTYYSDTMRRLSILMSIVVTLSGAHISKFMYPEEWFSQVRIVGGNEATPHQFPYQVGLFVTLEQKESFCGGSLVSSNDVLTAAHCLEGAVSIVVILGGHNITDDSESDRQVQTSTNFTIHPDWNKSTLTNDLGFVHLDTDVVVNQYVQIIQLANGTDTFSGAQATASGWGKISDSQTTVSDILRYETNPILSNDDCKSTDSDYNATIQDTHLCLSGEGTKSICSGDSGGPLVISGNLQVGITSFNYKQCEVGNPSVFTRITEYTEWIQENSAITF